MEVNKEEAARCRDIGAAALRSGQTARAVKMFTKSLYLYPLPGVKALLEQAEKKLQSDEGGSSTRTTNSTNNNGDNHRTNYSSMPKSSSSANGFASSRSSSSASVNNAASSTASTTSNTSTGTDGRAYTSAQVQIVSHVLKAKEGGSGAHYRVLGITQTADEGAIKKAYRKLALKLHPDKNSAPHADEAFKAVGLAYATLSDVQKRTIYDRYGEEDPDNRGGGMGGGMRGGRGGNMHFNGQEVNPEDIFNMFFGGGMPGGMGGPGFRVHTSGMGPGFAFGGMNPNMQRARRQQQQQHQQQARQDEGIFGQLAQFIPLLLILFLSFFNMPGQNSGGATGGSRYFSLTPVNPFVNQLHTKLSKVKDIPYFVTDQFVRTIGRDRYQLSQVERMVEDSYKRYLLEECKNQKDYKKKLETLAMKRTISEQERNNLMRKANSFDLVRCVELEELFPQAVPAHSRVKQQHNEF